MGLTYEMSDQWKMFAIVIAGVIAATFVVEIVDLILADSGTGIKL